MTQLLRSILLLRLALGVQFVSAATGSGDFTGLVDIGGGRKMYLECRGRGSPTVVLVAGLRGSAEDWNIAEKPAPTVFAEVAKLTRVFAYDRPGTPVGEKPSRSDPVRQPTTAEDAVADLHALLSGAQEAGPYVLVGHSYGGLIARLYASTYSQDVCGVVLVDAFQRVLAEGEIRESLALYPDLERIDLDRSFGQVRAAPALHPCPLIVLSADRPWGPQVPSVIAAGMLPANVPVDFGYVTDRAQKRAQEQLAEIVPNAKHITNTKSGHDIHKEQPQLVIDSIRGVVDLFFSADIAYPRKLAEVGLGADNVFLYAIGRIVVWVPKDSPVDVEKLGIKALLDPSVRKIAVANPEHAPYGRAAVAAMKALNVYDTVASRLVYGENIAQTARAFRDFVLGDHGREVLEHYGFYLPGK